MRDLSADRWEIWMKGLQFSFFFFLSLSQGNPNKNASKISEKFFANFVYEALIFNSIPRGTLLKLKSIYIKWKIARMENWKGEGNERKNLFHWKLENWFRFFGGKRAIQNSSNRCWHVTNFAPFFPGFSRIPSLSPGARRMTYCPNLTLSGKLPRFPAYDLLLVDVLKPIRSRNTLFRPPLCTLKTHPNHAFDRECVTLILQMEQDDWDKF